MNPTLTRKRPYFSTVPTLVILFILGCISAPALHAQTFAVIHTFKMGPADGLVPVGGLTMDPSGQLYGATGGGGAHNMGMVFTVRHSTSGWIFKPLYSFAGRTDGSDPEGQLAIAPDGTLYGTTAQGGGLGCDFGCGTVFHLRPSPPGPSTSASWTETLLHRFAGGTDGAYPHRGDLYLDSSGRLFGTTVFGGISDYGTVYELTPGQGGWTETVLYSPAGWEGGAHPNRGVVMDSSGKLYVFGDGGPAGLGGVFQLSPSGNGWTEQILHFFDGSDGGFPIGSVIIDSAGKLYGTTAYAGENGGVRFTNLHLVTEAGYSPRSITCPAISKSTVGPGQLWLWTAREISTAPPSSKELMDTEMYLS